MSSIAKLNIENAEIKTASVEVKTLTISGKQVTLSVFRQLPLLSCVDPETYKLRGLPWGRVNYFWEKMDRNSLHVVWQGGETLYRALVGTDTYPENQFTVDEKNLKYAIEEGELKLKTFLACCAVYARKNQIVRNVVRWEGHDDKSITIRLPGVVQAKLDVKFQGELFDRWSGSYLYDYVVLRWYGNGMAENLLKGNEALDLAGWREKAITEWENLKGYRKDLNDTQAVLKDLKAEYARSYARLKSLDQLFIAV